MWIPRLNNMYLFAKKSWNKSNIFQKKKEEKKSNDVSMAFALLKLQHLKYILKK